jgi:GNAT superfamily N-acetyltransferase
MSLAHPACPAVPPRSPPGALLVADCGGQPAGCGLAALVPERTAEVRRLYARPAVRGNGIARTLMSHAHDHAARHGMTRLILDVLPARKDVIGFTGASGTPIPAPSRPSRPSR